MSAGSSSSAQTVGPLRFAAESKLPLVPCPKCGEEILELISGPASQVPGSIFFKCRLHDRNDSKSCPWYMFADNYEQMLIGKGLVEMRGSAGKRIRQEEANIPELTPLLADAASLKNGCESVAEKLQKLVDLGKIVAVSLVVVAIVLVVGVIVMFFK